MAEAAAYRGPDGIRYRLDGAVGMAHLAFHTTPEAVSEVQPLVGANGRLMLVADARLDHRDELIAGLTSRGFVQEKSPSDAALILASYLCWGKDCLRQINGDYAFAIWDAEAQELFCARDAIGIRLLHYAQVGQRLYIATAIGSILAAQPDLRKVNLPIIQDFLAGRYGRWVYQTAYEEIARLPQSYTMTVRDGRISLQRYWVWGEQSLTRYQRDEDYIAHYRELFEKATLSCLRTTVPVSVWSGGGLDSAVTATTVDYLLEKYGLDVDAYLHSAVFKGIPSADESAYAEALAMHCTRFKGSRLLPSEDCWGFKEHGRDGGYPLDEPEPGIDRALTNRLYGAARGDGCRVCLSGEGSDNALLKGAYIYLDVLRDVPLKHLREELPYFIARSGHSWLGILARAYLRPAMPNFWRVLKRFKRRPEEMGWKVPTLPPPDEYLPVPEFSSQGGRTAYETLTRGHYAFRLAYFDILAASNGFEERYPFLDRRLVEYSLQIPPHLRFRRGTSKLILRQAFADILPAKISSRKGNTHLGDVIEPGVLGEERQEIEALLTNARVVSGGLIDEGQLRETWNTYVEKRDQNCYHMLMDVLPIEDWLRFLEDAA